MAEITPPRPKSYRIGSLQSFLPLSDTYSTRRQKLPSILQSRSSSNIKDLRGQTAQRRSDTPGMEGDEESDVERDGDIRDSGFLDRSTKNNRPGRGARRSSGISDGSDVLMTPQMRSMRLIGNSNPRYRWEQYYKTPEQLSKMKKPIREYYEKNNHLISSYLYIDRLLDSSLPHSLIQEYNHEHDADMQIPPTIPENPANERHPSVEENGHGNQIKVKRTPKALYKLPDENTPLLGDDVEDGPRAFDIQKGEEALEESGSKVVTFAIYLNLAANAILLAGKIAVIVLTSSLSVLASLVDAALDFLSTAIVWVTTKLISKQDRYLYPVGRRRLEPIGKRPFPGY